MENNRERQLRKPDVQNEGKGDKGKQRMTHLVSLYKYMTEQGFGELKGRQYLLSSSWDKKLWRAMIVYVVRGHDT